MTETLSFFNLELFFCWQIIKGSQSGAKVALNGASLLAENATKYVNTTDYGRR
jgi:hypothetical protein